jgi:hypothetical protein
MSETGIREIQAPGYYDLGVIAAALSVRGVRTPRVALACAR